MSTPQNGVIVAKAVIFIIGFCLGFMLGFVLLWHFGDGMDIYHTIIFCVTGVLPDGTELKSFF